MAALGADPFAAVKFLFQGAFGSRANIGTTLNKATPLMFTALCACFASSAACSIWAARASS